MSFKWNEAAVNAIKQKAKKAKNIYLQAAGFVASNEAKALVPVDTALLKNSIHFVVYTGEKSDFGNEVGKKKAKRILTEKDRLSEPKKDYVKVGSSVEYAAAVEKKFNFMVRALDTIKREKKLKLVAKESFKKAFKGV